MKTIGFIACIVASTAFTIPAYAQGTYVPDNSIPVAINGSNLKNPWAGGYNAPMFSQIDLDGDGIKDLFVFDKEGNRVTTYINNGTPNTVDYVLAPQYKKKFPITMHDWVILKDFDCDGKEDIFTYSYSGGMSVYRNDFSAQTGLKFNLVHNLVMSKYGTITANLYISPVNLPALVDVDYDGDLDVLTFPVAGNYIEFHKNMGKELFNKCDTLVYEFQQNCFGNFGLSGNSNSAILNISCRLGAPTPPAMLPPSANHSLHSGSCMIAVDIDGDLDYDLLNGDILGDNILLVGNGGTSTAPNMTFQDTAFPVYNTPVDLFTFPAPYYMDVNNDGNKDFIVAPCISGPSENYNNILYYRNTTNNTTNIFNLEQNRFLIEDMIDVGAGANVSFVDIDSDGLKDMIIGNFGYYSAVLPFESGLSYYRNIGTATNPAFGLQTIDFGNFFSLPTNTGLDPAFGDLDSDGDLDLILGQTEGTLIYYTNTAGQGNPPAYTVVQPELLNNLGSPIDVGQNSAPQIVDVNRDGKLDLIIGERSGNINYYENTGTATAPVFTLVNSNLGGVDVSNVFSLYSYSTPCLYDSAGTYQLLVGAVNGYIYQYNNIDNNLNGTFTLVDSMFYDIHEADRITVDVADLNGDGIIEVLTGNSAGGVTLYKYDNTIGLPSLPVVNNSFIVYPNPVSDELYVKFDTPFYVERKITIIDLLGREVEQKISGSNVVLFETSGLAQGVYHCRVIEGSKVSTLKFMVK
ncbi:MAG: T9SS type A sorting domain-containing protein [Bacteroidota bacterium]|nr:T9SS type A sorting domain-containing protein [Bacteroidota bacterium]